MFFKKEREKRGRIIEGGMCYAKQDTSVTVAILSFEKVLH